MIPTYALLLLLNLTHEEQLLAGNASDPAGHTMQLEQLDRSPEQEPALELVFRDDQA